MIAYLNDWSLACTSGVLANLCKIKAFDELMGQLAQQCGVIVYAPKNLWQIPLAGYDVNSGTATVAADNYLTTDHKRYLRSFYGRLRRVTEGYPLFSEAEDMSHPSSSVGSAAKTNASVLSIDLDGRYAKDVIGGWLLSQEDGEPVAGSVVNIYKSQAANYRYFADLTPCSQINPLENPLWNNALVSEYLKDVDFVNVDAKERQSLLEVYGRKLAEMNGWIYDERVTKLNQNSGQLRYIFSSAAHFTGYPIAYLSLDMEGPDLCFELCDRKGKHHGEYSWDGSSKAPKEHHDIKVKG